MTARLRGLIEMPVGNGLGGGGAQGLPESNVLEMRLAGGSRVLVRPSGVEPKIKAYAFARGLRRKHGSFLTCFPRMLGTY